MRKLFAFAVSLLLCGMLFAQEETSKKFSGVTFVSFKSHLTYKIGEDTATYPAARTL